MKLGELYVHIYYYALSDILYKIILGAAVAEWLSSWLAEQEDQVSPLEFSEIGYLLLPSRDMAERSLNRR